LSLPIDIENNYDEEVQLKMMMLIIILLGILLALFGLLKRKETYGKLLLGVGTTITILGWILFYLDY